MNRNCRTCGKARSRGHCMVSWGTIAADPKTHAWLSIQLHIDGVIVEDADGCPGYEPKETP